MKKTKTRTIVNIPDNPFKAANGSSVCSIGSCFAQDIVAKLFSCGFSGAQNPTGIIYNAVSIAKALEKTCGSHLYNEDDFFEFNAQWHSWQHHGRFSAATLKETMDKCNKSLLDFREQLQKSSLLIITVSSAVVYVHGSVICANCHRVPNQEFKRRLLSVEENLEALNCAVSYIRDFNKACRIILTLSPVRHYPGDLLLNSRSKAHLRTAIGCCVEQNTDMCTYFPAYEIVMDELRDYSFYNDDLLHLNPAALKIIFERFLTFLLR